MNVIIDHERIFNAPDITSDNMKAAYKSWFDLYFDTGCCCELASDQRIPCVIVDGLSQAVFGEYEYSIDDSDNHTAFADTMASLDKQRKKAFQMALVGGESFIKPIPREGKFEFTVIRRDAYVVFARDDTGSITSMGTSERIMHDKYYYTLYEKRSVDERGILTIENKLYRSAYKDTVGNEVPLSTLDRYAGLAPAAVMPAPIKSLGLIPIKVPLINCVDGSCDGVSIYAAAVGAILKLYTHARRADDEFELTEPHLIASSDLQLRDEASGELIEIPKYVLALDDDPKNVGMTIYNPTPHQPELEARENLLLRHIEDICGLRRGMLSHVDTEDKTATEILTSSGRYALLIKDLQEMWEGAIEEARRLLSIIGPMYGIWAGDVPEVTLAWGNGVLYDEDKEYQRLREAVNMGDVRAEYIPAFLFDEKLETDEDFKRVQEKYMPDMSGLENRRTVYE